jgi:hypothetical protein
VAVRAIVTPPAVISMVSTVGPSSSLIWPGTAEKQNSDRHPGRSL